MALLAAALPLMACTQLTRLPAVPAEVQKQATILDRADLRYWADQPADTFAQSARSSLDRERLAWAAAGNKGPLPPIDFLAISGGGDNGAFGAGLLVGWTAAGTRPQFKGVTGISTGALMAPLAFLGPTYDKQLREAYTEISARDIFAPRSYLAAYLQDAFADTTPLQLTIAKYFDQAMLDAIALEHDKGRILLIGTTDLDARQPIIWNITEIAASRRPEALELVRNILLASSAIPGAFPPVLFDVEVDGKHYQEMHVDGGSSAQVFVYPRAFNVEAHARALGVARERRLYVIRNARLDPGWGEVQRRTLFIAGQAIASLIQSQGVGDLYRIYSTTQRDRIEFNLAFMPKTFEVERTKPFDTNYMRQLFDVGYDLAKNGYPWAKLPPGYTAPDIEPPPDDVPSPGA